MWKHEQQDRDGFRRVRGCQETIEDWLASGRTAADPYLLVRLGALSDDQIRKRLNTEDTRLVELVLRVTGGLPGAVTHLAREWEPSPGMAVSDGQRNVLEPDSTEEDGRAGLWRGRLEALLPQDGAKGLLKVKELLDVVAYVTAPWLIPVGTDRQVGKPLVGKVLTEIRDALWIEAAHPDPEPTADHVRAHPWLQTTLVATLLEGETNAKYIEQFTALRDEPSTKCHPERVAYCQLALGDIENAVDYLTETFDEMPVPAWVAVVKLVSSAPNDLPRDIAAYDLYTSLPSGTDGESTSELRPTIRRLLLARWLRNDLRTVQEPRLNSIVNTSVETLRRASQANDISGFDELNDEDGTSQ